IKAIPQDFEVEEIPAYTPCGDGEHLFLWIEKTGLPAAALTKHVARSLELSPRDVGCAGLKDTHAVTRQFISVPAKSLPHLPRLETPQVRLLSHGLHRNKLKTGHLRGNRFTVVIRDPGPDAAARAAAIVAHLEAFGVPNFYGQQRFGRDGQTLGMGLRALHGEAVPELDRPGAGSLRRLALSSVQSALFNEVLSARLADGLLHTVLPGDVLQVCASGGPFVTDDVAREQTRFDAREVVLAGPMFGPKMRQATGVARAREDAVLTGHGLSLDDFARHGKLLLGTRRPLIMWPEGLTCAATADGLRLQFTLPAGAYATTVLRELIRDDAPPRPA
ncbi:MAG TPA: tRNA pseudouridine(13) synthase TruD, partial [Myxococcota bacterium]|nr:tRNA pseudouridine(13) synthase TruD [Myxococcota bacterium]